MASVELRTPLPRPPIEGLVQQHVEDAAHLRRLRTTLVRSPVVTLRQLARWDDRLAAHLDGIGVAGAAGLRLTLAGLERVDRGTVFVACIRALEDGDTPMLAKLLAASAAIPHVGAGIASAFGWVSAGRLKGVVGPLLQSVSAWDRGLALTACGMHGVDPGAALRDSIRDVDASVRARAFRVTAQCARVDLLPDCLSALSDTEEGCALEAAQAAVLLGDRGESVARLEQIVVDSSAASVVCARASAVLLATLVPARSRAALRNMKRAGATPRPLIRGFAAAGDAACLPWLIDSMKDDEPARIAGEAFTFITGIDVEKAGLTRDAAVAPSAADGAIDDDDDAGLPWPDHAKVLAWWHSRQRAFDPGKRYFFGDQPSLERCHEVLAAGTQRQRSAAAIQLALLHPGLRIFDIAAPAWRQRRALSAFRPR